MSNDSKAIGVMPLMVRTEARETNHLVNVNTFASGVYVMTQTPVGRMVSWPSPTSVGLRSPLIGVEEVYVANDNSI